MSNTVQAYIEEIPAWSSGTAMASAPLSSMQWLVWSLATAGKFFEGMIVFMGGIALPLLTAELPCFHEVKKHCFKNEWIIAIIEGVCCIIQ